MGVVGGAWRRGLIFVLNTKHTRLCVSPLTRQQAINRITAMQQTPKRIQFRVPDTAMLICNDLLSFEIYNALFLPSHNYRDHATKGKCLLHWLTIQASLRPVCPWLRMFFECWQKLINFPCLFPVRNTLDVNWLDLFGGPL